MSFQRGDWYARLQTHVSVEALADVWRIEAQLIASDEADFDIQRTWTADIPRDHV